MRIDETIFQILNFTFFIIIFIGMYKIGNQLDEIIKYLKEDNE